MPGCESVDVLLYTGPRTLNLFQPKSLTPGSTSRDLAL
jgi:hypothetical protein